MSFPTQRDWFEFILDLGLLERHLSQINPEPSGCSLIVQFLYHANMTEQLYKPDLPDPQVEIKSKRIKILRVLAIKSASILNWNLLKFEKEIPIAVMSDLLHIFLRLTMNDNIEPNDHSQIELEKLESQTLFALQILHRWCIRNVIFSKFPKKPPTKPVSVNMPGSLNPLQHMKDANENILKVITQNVQESVDFLEKMFNTFTGSVYKPISNCFENINSETGSYDLKWSESLEVESKEIKAFLAYDLGMHFFQMDNFDKAFSYFKTVKDFIEQSEANQEIISYANELNSYLVACKSMLKISFDQTDPLINTNDSYTKQVVNKIIAIDTCLSTNPINIYNILKEDNKTCQFSLSYRLSLIDYLKKVNADHKLIELVNCLNIIRLICDSNCVNYNLEFQDSMTQVISDCIDELNIQSRQNLIYFINLNIKRFYKKNQIELKKILAKYCALDLKEIEVVEDENVEMTPSSPPPESTTIDKYSLLSHAKLCLQTSDPFVLKNSINKYNQESKVCMRFFWPKWQFYANELNNIVSNANYMANSYKLNNPNEADYFYICYAKIQQLIRLNKFSIAFKLHKSYENSYGGNQKLNKFIRNQHLYLLIRNYMHNFDYSYVRDEIQSLSCKLELKKHSIPINQDEILKQCKIFFDTSKNDSDISTEMIVNVLGFLLTIGDFSTILSQETLFQKKNIMNVNSPLFSILKLTRQIARICVEMNKLDKNTLRKIARELWDNIIDIFTDQAKSDQSQAPQSRDLQLTYQIREGLRKMFFLIKNRQVRSLIISVLTTIYNVAETQANSEIHNELRYLWPSSLANVTTLNLNSLTDMLTTILFDSLYSLNPFELNWLKTNSDILNTKNMSNDSIKGYLQVLICETKHFFKLTNKKTGGQKKLDDEIDDKIIRSLIKSCLSLNKHTQAALLCQCLSNNNNYGAAFKYLQDGAWSNLTSDDMDILYTCIWDMALLEYIANLNYQRGCMNKKNICLKLIAKENINPANPAEIYKKTVDAKKSQLFLKLLNYYF